MDRSERAFAGGLSRLRAYSDAHGHARVAAKFRDADGHRLGNWAVWQRHRARVGAMTDEQQAQLEALGFPLDGRSARVDAALAFARAWVAREGDLSGLDGSVLAHGIQVRSTLLRLVREHRLPPEDEQFLRAAGLHRADPDTAWQKNLEQLAEFVRVHGRPPSVRKGEPLAHWRHRQLSAIRRRRLSAEQAQLFQGVSSRRVASLEQGPACP